MLSWGPPLISRSLCGLRYHDIVFPASSGVSHRCGGLMTVLEDCHACQFCEAFVSSYLDLHDTSPVVCPLTGASAETTQY